MTFDVAVLIVTYNSARQIEACLQSVLAQRQTVQQQIVVVDNQSVDGTAEIVRTKFPDVTLITPGRNLGFAAGVNLAAQHADAEYLLLLNPDTVVLDHAIDTVVWFANENPRHGIYGGRTLRSDGALEPSSCWGLPSLWSLAMFATGLSTFARRNRWFDPESLGTWGRDSVREVGFVTGCFLLVARDVWAQLGGLDERYFLYGEDMDFGFRAWRAGYRPVICPDARVVHSVGQSSATPTHKLLLLYQGKASYFRKNYSGLSLLLALAFLELGVGWRMLLSKLIGRSHRAIANDWGALWRARRKWRAGYSQPASAA